MLLFLIPFLHHLRIWSIGIISSFNKVGIILKADPLYVYKWGPPLNPNHWKLWSPLVLGYGDGPGFTLVSSWAGQHHPYLEIGVLGCKRDVTLGPWSGSSLVFWPNSWIGLGLRMQEGLTNSNIFTTKIHMVEFLQMTEREPDLQTHWLDAQKISRPWTSLSPANLVYQQPYQSQYHHQVGHLFRCD